MKRFLTTLILLALCLPAVAQQTIALDKSGENNVVAQDGKLSVNIAGMSISLGGEADNQTEEETKKGKVKLDFAGIGRGSYNHLALFEIGTNFVINTDFSNCSQPVQQALDFSTRKAVNVNINLMTMNIVGPKRILGFSLGFGFAMENYTFDNNVSLKYDNGFEILPLEQSVTKSKLAINYIHIPMLMDINIGRGVFFSAGAVLDVLMSSQLSYKKPKTKLEDRLPLNPLQVGVTARVGWRRVYGYVNYSLLNMYKPSIGVEAYRMSAGVGIWF